MKPEVIVVLGGGIRRVGMLSDTSRTRITKAVGLFKKLKPKALVISGKWSLGYRYIPKRTEAAAGAELAVQLGMPSDKVLTETESMETIGNAYFVKKRILEPKRWRRVLIVSSDFHISRAGYVFKKVLGPEYRVDLASIFSGWNPIRRIKLWMIESGLLSIYKRRLGSIKDGDDGKIKSLLDKLSGYSDSTKLSLEKLISLIR